MKIRRATVDDAKGVARCQIHGWQAGYEGIFPADFLKSMDLDARIERTRNYLGESTDDKYTLVADLDGKIVGFLGLGPPRDDKAGFSSEIWALYVDPDHWGQGTGRALFDEMVQNLKSRDISNTYVWCLRDNTNGRKFYKSLGGIHIHGLTKTFELEGVPYDEVAFGWVKL